jgi:hypothetical protein
LKSLCIATKPGQHRPKWVHKRRLERAPATSDLPRRIQLISATPFNLTR